MSNTEIVKGMYAAFNSGDIATVLDNLTEDVEWNVPGAGIPFAGRYEGRSGVAGFFQKLVATSDTDPLSSTGRSKPLQKQISTGFAMVFTLSGGKVVKFQEYLDTAAVASSYADGAQAARS